MRSNLVDFRELLAIATEALWRYRLRTSLSVLGVVLGVAAVIAMMSVSEGAAREALSQVEALGLDNLVARSQTAALARSAGPGLTAGDADLVAAVVPLAVGTSPLIKRFVAVDYGTRRETAAVLGVRASFQHILRLSLDRGRFLSPTDEITNARTCVLGAQLARRLFDYRDPLGQSVRVGQDHYQVVGVLRAPDAGTSGGAAVAWHDIHQSVFVSFQALSGRSLAISPGQPADEVWLQLSDGTRVDEIARIFEHTLAGVHAPGEFSIVVPRELLAQRFRTQRTFSVVVGSVAVLALLVGGIGIMNIMLTSVVERTREIGVRRTAGATRRDVALQFLIETLLMTVGGGAVGILIGALTSVGISAYAGWSTYVSAAAVGLGFLVSFVVGLVFGLYPAMKAARLEPVDAMRFE